MTIIADITVPSETFALGRLLDEFPDVTIEIERIVPLEETIMPLFWVGNADPELIETTFQESPRVNTVARLTTADSRTLFELHWDTDINGVVRALIDTRARILEAEGTVDTWDFRLRFDAHEDLTAFNQSLTGGGIPVTLRHLYNPTLPDEKPALSDEQREALLQAYSRGYFGIPRGCTLDDLAEGLSISDSALSQRLRRGTATLVKQHLLLDEQPSE
ncbi:MAG: helix-turn-helix domain-containing protein [Halalkalicoccus sp.]|nr:helix-turn-helix domain-containing protein [Halalkalicoccus sp.]